MILDKFPTADEFYSNYWGKKPFVVRSAVDQGIFDELIDGDSLAGLALEDDIKSRIVTTASGGDQWTCEHGPFEEDKFSSLGEKNWSLLVQNVEQYHTDTAKLLGEFHFSPRWLMDDIMVSYSAKGGSVGPHTDSYHVFLVQGMGRRKWRLAHSAIKDGEHIEGLDLKVLKQGFAGYEVEVEIGDVIYIPPNFAHEGTTIENSLTFSVGFLGPKISEMLIEYGAYLEQMEKHENRYSGHGLDVCSGCFIIGSGAQKTLQGDLVSALQSDDFSKWLAVYFSTPTHDEIENIESRAEKLSNEEIIGRLQEGQNLYRPEHVKISITTLSDGVINLAVLGSAVQTLPEHDQLIDWLNENRSISMSDMKAIGSDGGSQCAVVSLIAHLYNQNILFFQSDTKD